MVQASGESGQTSQNRPKVVRLVTLAKLAKPAWPVRHGSKQGITCMTIFNAEQNKYQDEMRHGAS
jgi:hypothetical protein